MTIYKISGLKPITHGSEPENLQRAKGPAIIWTSVRARAKGPDIHLAQPEGLGKR